ncbi:Gluconate transport-inducing protein, partial [Kickxella alabastrina]
METYYGFVSTSEDALALFEACRLGYKQRVPRRLSDDERAAIRSGSVFVWEETESGMKRWTDGRSWSPSRVQGCFLTYHEWEGRRRAQRHPSYHHMHGFNMPLNIQGMVGQPMPMGIARYGHFIGGPTKAGSTQVQYGFPKENGMLKKALSIRTTDGKKLHIIAYYSKEDHAHRRLMTPTSDPNFPRLVVPPNLYPDMSPESMYGASHSMNAGGSNEPDYPGPATVAQTADSGGMHAYEDAMMSGNRSDDSGSGSSSVADRKSRGAARQLKANDSMDIDNDVQQQQHRVGMQSPPVSSSSAISASATHNYTQQQYYSRRLSSPSPSARISHFAAKSAESAAKAAAAAAAMDALSVGLHRARVQSLVMDTD